MKEEKLHVYISIPCVYHAARHPDMECRSATDLKLWFSNYAAIQLEPRRGNLKPDNDARIFIYRIYMLFNSLLVLSASWIQPRASELQEALIEEFYGKRRSARNAGRSGYNEFLNKSSSMSEAFNDASCYEYNPVSWNFMAGPLVLFWHVDTWEQQIISCFLICYRD